jgi:hypothetical protein
MSRTSTSCGSSSFASVPRTKSSVQTSRAGQELSVHPVRGRHGRARARLFLIRVYRFSFGYILQSSERYPVLAPIALASLSHAAHAQASSARTSQGCIERAAATISNPRTTSIESAKLPAGNRMPGLPAGQPQTFEVFVLVDTTGRADSTTIRLSPGLDDQSVKAIRNVLPGWRFFPAMVGACPVRQVVKVRFSRQ